MIKRKKLTSKPKIEDDREIAERNAIEQKPQIHVLKVEMKSITDAIRSIKELETEKENQMAVRLPEGRRWDQRLNLLLGVC
ncbi:uncharacterized protein G2W53_030886 [Senna tora]|uniref:Uncharacterized protein n=1 Tax=Senna tora TaxID=362788 RepID=A0A834T9U1_9FABA|nr:uncharacterized protein G2W53_030886 [Senna tora]